MKKVLMIVALMSVVAMPAWAWKDAWQDGEPRRAPQPSPIVSINLNTKTDNMGNHYRAQNGLVFDNFGNTYQPVKGGVVDVRDGHFIPFVR